MAKYRKKPVVIEAIQVKQAILYDEPPLWHIERWVGGLPTLYDAGGQPIRPPDTSTWIFAPDHIVIPTLEGDHRADLNDWIVRGVKGEFYPVKPDIFALTYEPAD